MLENIFLKEEFRQENLLISLPGKKWEC